MRSLRNQKGQSLIEYVILVALVGVATIGLVRVLQKTVKVNLANVVHSLQGSSHRESQETLTEDDVRKSDFNDFMNGAANRGR
jgi:Flp pilus assembly pilin Flp